MVDSDLLLYYFVRSFRIINKMAACIAQMQRPEIILLSKNFSRLLHFFVGKEVKLPGLCIWAMHAAILLIIHKDLIK